jgi:ketosteroid isomerase-like protein
VATTQSVLDHHLQCFGTGDVDGIMQDYSPDAALLLPDGALRGDAIRDFFKASLAEFAKPGTTMEMKQCLVHGDCAFIVWNAETPDNRYEAASDTFLVRDGKILVQTFAAKISPK